MDLQNELISRLHTILPRLIRYLAVGGVVNFLLYAGYLAAVGIGLAPEVATSLAFIFGISMSFFLNRGWAFKSDISAIKTAPRYLCAYAAGFGVQFMALFGLHRGYEVPHYFAQLLAMGAAAVTIFLCLHFWVFQEKATDG